MLIALLTTWLALFAAKGTPIGDMLHRAMVEAPARRLSRITRGQLLLVLTLITVSVAIIWLLENDGRMLVAMGLPDVVSLAVAIDAASLIDLALVAVVAASAVRISAIRAWFGGRTGRRPRGVLARRLRPPANDDEKRPALAA